MPRFLHSSTSFLLLLFFLLASISSSLPLPPSTHRHSLSLPASNSNFKLRPWPCCNTCGGCTKSIPPRCQCHDLLPACHPMCQNCVRSPLSADPPLYQCMDLIPNYCKHKCSAASPR